MSTRSYADVKVIYETLLGGLLRREPQIAFGNLCIAAETDNRRELNALEMIWFNTCEKYDTKNLQLNALEMIWFLLIFPIGCVTIIDGAY